MDDNFTIDFDFDHDPKAILNDIDGKIYINDDIITDQLNKVYKKADYHSWEIKGNSFFLDFFLNKKYSIDSILNHYNSILGEYFKFYLDKEEADDFEESGDYFYTLKGDLIKGEMAPY